jgi:hypothetical protein
VTGVERGNTKHSPRQDEALADQIQGELGPGGSNREEWASGEPPADDDPPARTGPPVEELPLDEREEPGDTVGD